MLMEEKKVKQTANQKVVAKCMKKIEAREADSIQIIKNLREKLDKVAAENAKLKLSNFN